MASHGWGAGKTRITITIDEAAKARLEQLAKASGMSLNTYCKSALEQLILRNTTFSREITEHSREPGKANAGSAGAAGHRAPRKQHAG